jgi:hypothetical protein
MAWLATSSSWRRPQAAAPVSAPVLMLLLSVAGMAAGILIDGRAMNPAGLASLCSVWPDTFPASALRHAAALPATTGAMLLGGFATMPAEAWRARRRLGRKAICACIGFNLACNAAMLAGMLFGAWRGPAIAASLGFGWDLSSMIATMTAGMTGGMAGMMVSYQAGLAVLDWARPAPAALDRLA